MSTHVISFDNGYALPTHFRYNFDITLAVQGWKDGNDINYDQNKGIIFKASSAVENGSVYNSRTFSSYNRAEYRPSFSMTYAIANRINLNYSTLTMNIGESKTLTVASYSPSAYSLRWKSLNPRIATINSTTGELRAISYGKIAIRAYLYEDPTVFADITLTVEPSPKQASGIVSGSVYMIKNVSTNKYLSASSSGLSLKSKNEMDGSQLWYVVWTSSGYKLYSMGVKDTASNGEYETVLQGNGLSRNGNSAYILWDINKYGGYFYISNYFYLYNNKSLSANASNSNVALEILNNESQYARWSFEKINAATFNNYWKGGFSGQGDTIYVKIKIDSSGSDSVYSNSIISSNHFDVVNQWKNKSSHVVIYGPNDTVPSNITAFEVEFKGYVPAGNILVGVIEIPLENIVCGETNGHKKGLLWDPEVEPDQDWNSVVISLNTSSSGPLVGNDDLIRKTIIHELGHALKLAHPKHANYIQDVPNGRGSYAGDNSVCALMNQGDPNDTLNLACATPKWHDIINLKNKWGE